MAKQDFVDIDPGSLADLMHRPTRAARPSRQPSAPPVPRETPRAKPKKSRETQFSLSLRKELREQIDRMAYDKRMTMRAFVLNALKDKGLKVGEEDLADQRKR